MANIDQIQEQKFLIEKQIGVRHTQTANAIKQLEAELKIKILELQNQLEDDTVLMYQELAKVNDILREATYQKIKAEHPGAPRAYKLPRYRIPGKKYWSNGNQLMIPDEFYDKNLTLEGLTQIILQRVHEIILTNENNYNDFDNFVVELNNIINSIQEGDIFYIGKFPYGGNTFGSKHVMFFCFRWKNTLLVTEMYEQKNRVFFPLRAVPFLKRMNINSVREYDRLYRFDLVQQSHTFYVAGLDVTSITDDKNSANNYGFLYFSDCSNSTDGPGLLKLDQL